MSLGLEHVNGCAWIFFEPQPTLQGQGEALEGGQGGMKPSFLEIVDSVPPSTDPGCASMLGFFLHECSGVQVLWAFCQTLHRGVIRYATWREEAGKPTKIECQPRPPEMEPGMYYASSPDLRYLHYTGSQGTHLQGVKSRN